MKYFTNHPEQIKDIDKSSKDVLWLKRADVDKFRPLKCNNARLERVKEHVFQNKAELLLRVPPSKPYYTPGGVFKSAENFSKTLIFSSWEMVPRMVSCMLSYEEERRTVGVLARNNENMRILDSPKGGGSYVEESQKHLNCSRKMWEQFRYFNADLLSVAYSGSYIYFCFSSYMYTRNPLQVQL